MRSPPGPAAGSHPGVAINFPDWMTFLLPSHPPVTLPIVTQPSRDERVTNFTSIMRDTGMASEEILMTTHNRREERERDVFIIQNIFDFIVLID